MPSRFDPDIDRLSAILRGHRHDRLISLLQQHLERVPAAALATDDTARYLAANASAQALTGYTAEELRSRTVMDLTPTPLTLTGEKLWGDFIGAGTQHGRYDLRRKDGTTVAVRYWAYASVAPGIHLSVLVPVGRRT